MSNPRDTVAGRDVLCTVAAYEPVSGADICEISGKPSGTVYPMLGRLVLNGLVEVERPPVESGRPVDAYSMTQKGREELALLLAGTLPLYVKAWSAVTAELVQGIQPRPEDPEAQSLIS